MFRYLGLIWKTAFAFYNSYKTISTQMRCRREYRYYFSTPPIQKWFYDFQFPFWHVAMVQHVDFMSNPYFETSEELHSFEKACKKHDSIKIKECGRIDMKTTYLSSLELDTNEDLHLHSVDWKTLRHAFLLKSQSNNQIHHHDIEITIPFTYLSKANQDNENVIPVKALIPYFLKTTSNVKDTWLYESDAFRLVLYFEQEKVFYLGPRDVLQFFNL